MRDVLLLNCWLRCVQLLLGRASFLPRLFVDATVASSIIGIHSLRCHPRSHRRPPPSHCRLPPLLNTVFHSSFFLWRFILLSSSRTGIAADYDHSGVRRGSATLRVISAVALLHAHCASHARGDRPFRQHPACSLALCLSSAPAACSALLFR